MPDTGASRLPLARVSEEPAGSSLPLGRDMLFTGHADGSVKFWGVGRVDTSDEDEAGSASFWRGLTVHEGVVDEAAVSCIAIFEEQGLLAVGDSAGGVLVCVS